MKKLFLLAALLLGLSCGPRSDAPVHGAAMAQDSILVLYKRSKDRDLPLAKRREALELALALAGKNQGDSLYHHVLYQKNRLHLSLREYDSLERYHGFALAHMLAAGDHFNVARSYYLMGYYYDQVVRERDSAFQNYVRSKTYYERIGDSSWVGRNLLNMATIQKDCNDFFGSKETVTEALGYLSATGDIDYIAQAQNLLATDHRKLLNHGDAVTYYLRAMGTTRSQGDALIYRNNLAAAHIGAGAYEKAIPMLKGLLQDPLLAKNPQEHARVLDNLAYAGWRSGKKTEGTAFLYPLALRKELGDKRGQIASHTRLGEYHAQGSPTRAKAHLDTVIRLSRTLGVPRAEQDALGLLMELEPGNILLRDRYVALQDSLYAQELRVKTQFAKYKYDDRIKQESILRLEKEYAEKELEASRQKNQKLLFSGIGGFLVLVLVFFVSYFVQRSRRLQREKQIVALEASHKTEAELSRRLHDDFGGKLNRTMVMLQNDADTSEVMDVVEGLYHQSRDFSREINAVDTGPNFKGELLEMLRFRTPPNAKLLLSGTTEMDWGNLPPLYKTTLFKVLQELMINMGKHSKATLISIGFAMDTKQLEVAYADDGQGASKKDMHGKNGLRNTEKRIGAIGGSITFDSEKGNGFRAQIKIPR